MGNKLYFTNIEKNKKSEITRLSWLLLIISEQGLRQDSYELRLAEHKQYVRSKNLDKPSGGPFNQQGHELSYLGGHILEHVKSSDPFVLRAREYLSIQKFDNYRNGLNGEH